MKVGLPYFQNKNVTSGIIRCLKKEQWVDFCCSSVPGGDNSITGKSTQSS